MQRATHGFIALLSGTLTFLVLHLFFVLAWGRLFLVAPWPGYEENARFGLVEAWFINTPRSLWLTRTTFFLLAFASATVRRRRRWPTALLLWIGASLGLIATYANTSLPAMPAGQLGYFIYPFRLLLPILLGTALGGLLHRIRAGGRAMGRTEGGTTQ